jgi:hypothetical protein
LSDDKISSPDEFSMKKRSRVREAISLQFFDDLHPFAKSADCGTIGLVKRQRCLLVLTLLSLVVGVLRPAPADAFGERLVLAFYYAWFDQTTWEMGLPDQPVEPYTSSDPAAIERHVRQAQQAGIDAFVQSWYGPQVENNQTEPNFATLLDVAAGHGFAAAVDFEVTSPFFESQADVVAGLEHLLAVHAHHPAYLHVGGRPVVFFWRQNRFPVETWYDIRDRVDPDRSSIWIMEGVDLSYLGPFDGTHLYSVAWDAEPGATLRRWGERIRQWNAEHGSVKYWVATVMPGYNDLVTGRSDAFVRDRAGGAYYRDCWEGAIQSDADWVVITSFNEWLEGSQIEPSQAYGDQYLDLTQELGAVYRASEPLPPGVPEEPIITNPTEAPAPAAVNVVTVSPQATPSPAATPTVALPSPTASPMSTSTPTVAPSPTVLPMPTETGSPSATASPTPVPLATPIPLPTPLPTPPPPLERVAVAVLNNLGLVAAGAAVALTLGMALRRRWNGM